MPETQTNFANFFGYIWWDSIWEVLVRMVILSLSFLIIWWAYSKALVLEIGSEMNPLKIKQNVCFLIYTCLNSAPHATNKIDALNLTFVQIYWWFSELSVLCDSCIKGKYHPFPHPDVWLHSCESVSLFANSDWQKLKHTLNCPWGSGLPSVLRVNSCTAGMNTSSWWLCDLVTAPWSQEGCRCHTFNPEGSQIWISLDSRVCSKHIQTAGPDAE